MTYSEFKRATRFKPIYDYSEAELTAAIKFGEKMVEDHSREPQHYELKFWDLFNAFDAYIERRRRKSNQEAKASMELKELLEKSVNEA